MARLDGSSDAASTTTAGTTASSTSSGTSGSSTTDDGSSDAVGAFLQSLFAALHAQSTSGTTASATDSGTGAQSDTRDASASAHAVGRAHHHHGGKLEADLDSLIQSLGNASSTATTDASSATGVAGNAAPDPAIATLEQKFDALAATNGGSTSGDADALAAFLKSLATNLHGAPATGNVVATTA